jgi:UDP-3-O-[3-hydroxymyristoyl] glucosamine N-acyltransferase
LNEFENSNAGVILVSPNNVDRAPTEAALLILDDPYLGYAKLTQAFYPKRNNTKKIKYKNFSLSSSAKISKGVVIETGAVIEEYVEIGENSRISANTHVGAGVKIGSNCYIGSNVNLSYCIIGNNIIVHPGTCIGQDGFGFSPGMPHHIKVHQLGRVIIGDDVEIGANTTIDRGSGLDTIIGDGTKIDNLVHIAHNVKIGKGCFITAQNGFAGSANIGDFVSFGGMSGVAGHIKIGNNVQIAGRSGITTNIKAGQIVAGNPAQSARKHWQGLALLRQLVKEKRGE